MFKKMDGTSADAKFSLFLWTSQGFTVPFWHTGAAEQQLSWIVLMHNVAWLFLKIKHKKTLEI